MLLHFLFCDFFFPLLKYVFATTLSMTIKAWVESATNVRLCQMEGLQTKITLSDNTWVERGDYLSQSVRQLSLLSLSECCEGFCFSNFLFLSGCNSFKNP